MPKKFIGMHFFNPVPALKLVDIIQGIETSDETYEAVSNLAERLELPLRPRAQDSVLRRKPQHTLRLAVLRGRLLQGRRRSDGQVLRRPVFVPRWLQDERLVPVLRDEVRRGDAGGQQYLPRLGAAYDPNLGSQETSQYGTIKEAQRVRLQGPDHPQLELG